MKGYLLICMLAIGALAAPVLVSAETDLRTGNDVSVAPDQTVAGNYYVSVQFGKTTMSGVVEKDMIAIGASVTHNGEVKEDLQVLGGNVQVHGAVVEDLRVVGGEVTIADKVDNARSILADLQVHGEELWKRFNAGREDQLWYYESAVAAYDVAG